MPGFNRTNGNTVATSVYGLAPRYFKIETGNVSLGNTSTANTTAYYGLPGSNFEKAVFAVGSVASIITLGAPANNGNIFVVQVDNTFDGRGADDAKTTLQNVVSNALPTANAITVTESAGFVAGAFDTFA